MPALNLFQILHLQNFIFFFFLDRQFETDDKCYEVKLYLETDIVLSQVVANSATDFISGNTDFITVFYLHTILQ